MAVKIRMKRLGAKKAPFYRIVVADSRRARNGRFIEEIGFYNPVSEPRMFRVDADKVKAWIANGAQPSDTIKRLFREYGVMEAEGVVASGLSTERKPKAKVVDFADTKKETAEEKQEAVNEPASEEEEVKAEDETAEA
ncbi:30S ribosomal protein S16 [Murdochiella sp. Marseille-P8839]|nr:30S ribosomal protein S16 [Murdochiella sp. Marseille-P8839]